jgi:hypothetical protein
MKLKPTPSACGSTRNGTSTTTDGRMNKNISGIKLLMNSRKPNISKIMGNI